MHPRSPLNRWRVVLVVSVTSPLSDPEAHASPEVEVHAFAGRTVQSTVAARPAFAHRRGHSSRLSPSGRARAICKRRSAWLRSEVATRGAD